MGYFICPPAPPRAMVCRGVMLRSRQRVFFRILAWKIRCFTGLGSRYEQFGREALKRSSLASGFMSGL